MPLRGCDCPFSALAAPACLSLAGDGSVCNWLALLIPLCVSGPGSVLGYSFSPDSSLSLFLSLSLSLSLSLAIPQSGLLSHISSLSLPLGHSGLVLTLSIASHASLSSPCLLVMDMSVWAASPLGVTVGHVICGFELFIYLFFLPVMLPSEIPRLTTDLPVRVFPGVWKRLSFLKLPSLDGSPSLPLLSLFLSFIFFLTSFRRQWAAFLGA